MVDNFLRGFIHDIRASVGVITQCLDPGIPGEFDKVGMAKRQADHALSLINELERNLNDAGTPLSGGPVTNLMLNGFLEGFVGRYPNVTVRHDDKVNKYCRVFVDLNLLDRVVDNCIINSVRAGRSKWVLLTLEPNTDVLQIKIKDGGIGMNAHQLERIGLGFSTTGGGSGTKILIDLLVRMGGTIRWDSIQDIGTCVTMTFKLIDGKPQHG